jgi:hypothetical protein
VEFCENERLVHSWVLWWMDLLLELKLSLQTKQSGFGQWAKKIKYQVKGNKNLSFRKRVASFGQLELVTEY